MTDFRALCVELIESVLSDNSHIDCMDIARRARAALAEEPAVPKGREPVAVTGQPSDEELALIYHDCCRGCEFMDQGGFENAARAVLARWGNPAPREPVSVTGQPSDEDLWNTADLVFQANSWPTDAIRYARAVLARWGNPAPQPVPVGERLPGPEDCDEDGRCWWLHVGEDGVGDWFQRAPYPSVTSYAFFRMTHWLPAHALPLPEVNV